MITYHLKTASKDKMIMALSEALLTNQDGELITATHDYFVSVCGVLYKHTSVILKDDHGNEYPEIVAVDGYHANLRTTDESIVEALQHITIDVKSPLIKIA